MLIPWLWINIWINVGSWLWALDREMFNEYSLKTAHVIIHENAFGVTKYDDAAIVKWCFEYTMMTSRHRNAFRITDPLCWEDIGHQWITHHYYDVIMDAIASQITSLTIVYSTVYSDTDQRKHQSSASLAFVWGIHRGPVNSPHKWPVTRKMFPFDDIIMTSAQ